MSRIPYLPLAEAIHDPKLLQPCWNTLSRPQQVAILAFYGQPLTDPGDLAIWAILNEAGGVKATGEDVRKGFKQTKNHHAFGGTGISCQDAIKPYIAVCATLVSASQWNGTALKAVKNAQNFSGLVVVGKGDALRTTEVK